MPSEIAIFAAGCFWGVQKRFDAIDGVTHTWVGYTGGTVSEPSYEDVCSSTTGHAEAVKIEFDPQIVTYQSLLEVFWSLHDPTTLNRQGPDIGTQYRSAIFYLNDEQHQLARAALHTLEASKAFKHPIVTEIAPASDFYVAEDYHQHYLNKVN